jgi:UDP-N-acetylmuramoylalanine--D-glutamate ligase
VTVFGLGTFGGQIAVARFFARRGARVTVTDKKKAQDLADSVRELEGLGIEFVLGEHHETDFTDTDLVVRSPAVPPGHELLARASAAGVPVTSEIVLTLERLRASHAAVTGTKGKSTTTALLGALLEAAGLPVLTGGNIGRPLLEDAEAIAPDARVVLELSSFMAEDLAGARAAGARLSRPRILIITSLSPEHLDRHGTKEAYYEAKLSLVDALEPGGAVVYSARGELAALAPERARRRGDLRILPVQLDEPSASIVRRDGDRLVHAPSGQVLFAPSALALEGAHNVENAALAAVAALELGADPAAFERGVAAFRPLPHRLETVARDAEGRRFVNDSIATTPEAATAALQAFSTAPVVVLLGGSEKGSDYRGLAQEVASRAHAAVCLGRTGPAIAALVAAEVERSLSPVPVVERKRAAVVLAPGGFEDAFALARELCPPGGVVLLSPACASYDMFRNFEARGERFRSLARASCGPSN